MPDYELDKSRLEYVADMLHVVRQAEFDYDHISPEAKLDLELSLSAAEASLRRVAAELKLPVNKL